MDQSIVNKNVKDLKSSPISHKEEISISTCNKEIDVSVNSEETDASLNGDEPDMTMKTEAAAAAAAETTTSNKQTNNNSPGINKKQRRPSVDNQQQQQQQQYLMMNESSQKDPQQHSQSSAIKKSSVVVDRRASESAAAAAAAAPVASDKQIVELIRSLRQHDHATAAPKEKHAFWDTQPVPKLNEGVPEDVNVGPIDKLKDVSDVRQTRYDLPPHFIWTACDVKNPKELQEIYSLLADNYVEDDDCMFRFNYSPEFLSWTLTPPGYYKEWHIGVRTDTGTLVCFITGVPATVSILGKEIRLAEINFLCVHKSLRSKRLAPVLIKEVTRQVNLKNIWQAIYTAGILVTKPVSQCSYFHRSLNIKKLLEVQFTGLRGKMTLSMAQKLYKLPDRPQISGLRPMQKKDIPVVLQLLKNELSEKTKIYPVYSVEDAEHVLLPRDNVIVSYVREHQGKVTDFLSFYILPSFVIGSAKHLTLRAAYCYYYAANSVTVVELMKDALIIAKQREMDVFNALNLGRNDSFIKELKFGKGDGTLRYHVYNYMLPEFTPDQIGLVMV